MSDSWKRLLCKSNELQLTGTLNGGQSFRWKSRVSEGTEEWIGVFKNLLWILKQEDDCILYKVYGKESDCDQDCEKLLKDYLRLDLNLEMYYQQWSEKDNYFKDAAKKFYGIRLLNQDVTENIFSFICSSNNHITRISSMVEKMAKFYGHKIYELDDETYYSFPEAEVLANEDVEYRLRDNGFGYRSKYICKSAQTIMENGGKSWLEALKKMEYPEAKSKLMTLPGVGAKVADCICLMSLGHLQAIPVDTHVYQIARRIYMPKLPQQKTITSKVYEEIGEYFRGLYGPLAGWAHTVLFCADLKKFQEYNSKYNENSAPNKKQKMNY
ncbi:N-glycosylase/DNA lyase isoform X2 [Aethina tumida]|nr:N-glycosylase/DNA lyase isoform X2 [Aethina tumida]